MMLPRSGASIRPRPPLLQWRSLAGGKHVAQAEAVRAEPQARIGAFSSFRFRDYRLLWGGLLLASFNTPLQFFVQAWFIQKRAGDYAVLLQGVLGAVLGGGMLLFSVYGGVLADRVDRRRLLMAVQGLSFVISTTTAVVMMVEPVGTRGLFAILFTLFFLAGSISSFDLPTRQALVPELVDREHLTNAISLNSAAFQIALPVSVVVSGVLIKHIGMGQTYLVGVGGHIAILIALYLMRYRSAPAPVQAVQRSTMRDVREGLAYARQQPLILWVILLMVATQGLGMPVMLRLGPSWFDQVLHQDAQQWGIIALTWGLAALAASFLLAAGGDFKQKGLLYLGSSAAFGASILFFGLVRSIPLVAVADALAGGTQLVTQVSAVALIQSIVPNRLLGRVMGLVAMTGGLNQLNSITVGGLGQGLGLEVTVPVLGAIVLGCSLLMWAGVPGLRRAQ